MANYIIPSQLDQNGAINFAAVQTAVGAVGVEFQTTGDIVANSHVLTITGDALPIGAVIGSGLGIVGAGPIGVMSTLTAGVGTSDTTIPVISTTGFLPVHGFALIDNEQIAYTSTDSTHFLGCTRGANGTSAAIHNSGASIADAAGLPWFPTPTLRAMITAINGNTITLSQTAHISVSGAIVYIDDSVPIQNALDAAENAGGGVVKLNPGTFIIGSPGASNNLPLLFGTNVTLAGSGSSVTTIKVCDKAAQILPTLLSDGSFSGNPQQAFLFPQCAVIANSHNTSWHNGKLYTSTTPTTETDPLLVVNSNGLLRDLTIDGNMANQYAVNRKNETGFVIPDAPAFNKVTVTTLSGSPPANALKNSHTYYAQVIYADINGNQAGSPPAIENVVIPASGNYQLNVTCLTPPAGAANALLYIIDLNDSNFGTAGGWYWPSDVQSQLQDNNVWSVTDLGYVPASGAVIVIDSYSAAPATPENRPPAGNSYVQASLGFSAGASNYCIFLDNCDSFTCQDLICQNGALDGVTLGAAEPSAIDLPAHPVTNALITDIYINNCGREALGITAAVDNITFQNITATNCPWAIDIELDAAGNGFAPVLTSNITWRNCSFTGGVGYNYCQFNLGIFQHSPALNLKLYDCLFDRTVWNLSGGGQIEISCYNCTWQDTPFSALNSTSANCYATFAKCNFLRCGKLRPALSQDANTTELPTGVFSLSNGGFVANVLDYQRFVFSSCLLAQEDISQPNYQTGGVSYLGSRVFMNNVTVQTQTQPMVFQIGTSPLRINPRSISITSAIWDATGTFALITTAVPHGLFPNDTINILGASANSLNTSFLVGPHTTLSTDMTYANTTIPVLSTAGFFIETSALSADLTSSSTTIATTGISSFPVSGKIQIDSEQIFYSGKASTTLTGCIRGFNGTSPTSHSNGASITNGFLHVDVNREDITCNGQSSTSFTGLVRTYPIGHLTGATVIGDSTTSPTSLVVYVANTPNSTSTGGSILINNTGMSQYVDPNFVSHKRSVPIAAPNSGAARDSTGEYITFNTTLPHLLAPGDFITVEGVNDPTMNGEMFVGPVAILTNSSGTMATPTYFDAIAVNTTDTVVNVVSTVGFPSSGIIIVGNEQISYTGLTVTTFTGLTRGINGTVASQTWLQPYNTYVIAQSTSSTTSFIALNTGTPNATSGNGQIENYFTHNFDNINGNYQIGFGPTQGS